MISYARMHKGSENRVYSFQSMAHGECTETKVSWPGFHLGLGALPLQTIAKANETIQGTTNGSCTSQRLLLDRMRVKNRCKTIGKVSIIHSFIIYLKCVQKSVKIDIQSATPSGRHRKPDGNKHPSTRKDTRQIHH